MSTIKEILDMNGRPIVMCSPHDSDFEGAKSITIYDKDGATFVLKDFVLERTKQCFSNRPIAPFFRVNEKVGDNFLAVGNRIDFNCQKATAHNNASRTVAKPSIRPSIPTRQKLAYA